MYSRAIHARKKEGKKIGEREREKKAAPPTPSPHKWASGIFGGNCSEVPRGHGDGGGGVVPEETPGNSDFLASTDKRKGEGDLYALFFILILIDRALACT